MAKHRTEEQPLSEVIGSRRKYFQAMLEQTLKGVYSGSVGYISGFEHEVSELCSRYSTPGKLEGVVERQPIEAQSTRKIRSKRAQRTGRRQRLTSYQYTKARDAGLTNEEIKAKYRMDSPYQINGFASQYAQRQKKK